MSAITESNHSQYTTKYIFKSTINKIQKQNEFTEKSAREEPEIEEDL